MDKKTAKEIIDKGESLEVEFKQPFHSFQEIAETICAFANTEGGILFLGVKNNGQIFGVKEDIDEVQQKISNTNNNIHSAPIIRIETLRIDSETIIAVIVHKTDVSTFHSYKGSIYVRIGTTTQKLEGNSMVEFLRNRQILLFEEGIEPNAKIEDLDINKIQEYLEIRGQKNFLKEHSVENFLLSKKIATKIPDLKIKNTALLFFAKNPQDFFPYVRIKLVRFDGFEPIKVLAYEEAVGNLKQMIDHSLNFVNRFLSKEFIIHGAKRKEVSIFPEEAIREAVINSIAHMDYFSKNEVQLSIFDDRIEITNPGGLPKGMNKDLLGVLSVQRNPMIYQFLKDYGYMEGIGSGISRIFSLMKDANLEKPNFIFPDNIFRIIFKIRKRELFNLGLEYNLNNRQMKALEFLEINKKIKSTDYSKINKITIQASINDLNKLIKVGLIKKIGKFRGAYYILNEDILEK